MLIRPLFPTQNKVHTAGGNLVRNLCFLHWDLYLDLLHILSMVLFRSGDCINKYYAIEYNMQF